MKFIFLFIILINSAWAINDISECLNPGRTIGTNYERPADIILLVPGTGTRGTILTLGHFGNLGGYFEQIENLFLSFFQRTLAGHSECQLQSYFFSHVPVYS